MSEPSGEPLSDTLGALFVTDSGVLLHRPAPWARMPGVGKHAAPAPRRSDRRRASGTGSARHLVVLALGVTATLVAWGFLVWAAIDFGGQARSGEATAWGLLALATVGAAACLFVTLILAGKIIDAFRGGLPAPPRVDVPPGGRRARR